MSLSDWFLPSEGRLFAEDLELLARVSVVLPEGARAGLLYPARHELKALPRLEAVTPQKWDLRFRAAKPFNALIAGRIKDFAVNSSAFVNALSSCQLLIVLESRPPEESSRLLAEVPVPGGALRLYRGDLTDPLLRVDDYPTGVRPILDDLSSLHEVLSRIDAAGLPFHLGIVPALLEDRMVPFLAGLSQLVVSMHGFEHAYAKSSKILRAAGDPFNQRGTIGGFDEFAGQSYERILEQLQSGRQILEARLGQLPQSYIPPCNAGNRSTGRALLSAGFEYVLTEKPIPGSELPSIASDFYDRSSAFEPGSRPSVASLHATWEADMLRAGDSQSLPAFLSALVAQRTRARVETATVADRVVFAAARG